MRHPSILIVCMLVACTTTVELDKNAPAHHTGNGTFVNTNGRAVENPVTDIIKWKREAPDVTPLNLPSVQPRLKPSLSESVSR